MKNSESIIFNKINSVFAYIQSKTDIIKQNSYLLSKIDIFILISIISTYIVSIFGQTNLIGCFAFFVPLLVFIKFIFTKGEKIELEKANFYILLYLIICLITNFTSSMLSQSIYGFMKTLMYIGFYFALCQFLKKNKKYIPILLITISILVFFEAVTGIIQNSLKLENISTWQDVSYLNPEDILSRVYGTLKPYNPNLLGGYMLAGISSFIGVCLLAFTGKHYKISIISLICFFISVFTIFLTGCRGAYIGLFSIALSVIFISYNIISKDLPNYINIWKKYLYTFIIASGIFMILNHKILYRIMSIFILRGDSSTSFRINVYNSAIQMLNDNWLYGIGVGNKVFREIYGLYMLSGYDALSCYCVFLEMAVESGIISLILYILFLITIIGSGIKYILNKNMIENKIIVSVAIMSIIAVMAHGIVDTIYFRPQIQFIYWTMAAIAITELREEKATE